MTTPAPATRWARLCPRCHAALHLDLELARVSIQAGWPAVELLRCRHGHSVRADAPHLRTGPAPTRPAHRCPVCGAVVLRAKGCSRKMCSDRCSRFVAGRRAQAYQRGEPFVLERQPWYMGPVTAWRQVTSLPPLDPLAGRMPREWVEGWLKTHGDNR